MFPGLETPRRPSSRLPSVDDATNWRVFRVAASARVAQVGAMAYESLHVRMSRSSPDIAWGFSLRQGARRLEVAFVARDSLAEKAGLTIGDEIDDVQGRRGLSLHDADTLVKARTLDISLDLQRSPSQSPQSSDMSPRRPSSPGLSPSKATSSSSRMSPILPSPSVPSPLLNLLQSNGATAFTKSAHSSWDSSTGRTHHIPIASPNSQANYSTRYETTNSSYTRNEGPTNGVSSQPPWSANTKTLSEWNSPSPWKSSQTTAPFSSSTTLPFHEPATIRTTTPYDSFSRPSATSPGRVLYHSPSPRSQRELSPHATVHHLQYNSPMNLYSTEAAAEQFRQQTGGAFGEPFPNETPESLRGKSPAYLTSETRALIAERESGGRLRRGLSPSTQSASFKRISSACGTPVN